jgi:predicted Zn-dependent protease
MKLDESSRTVSRKLEDLGITALEVAEQSRARRVGSSIVAAARRLVFRARHFSLEWLASRKYRYLLGGLPAIVIASAFLLLLGRLPLYSSHAKAQHYRRAIHNAIVDKNLQNIALFHRKLTQISARENVAVDYESAVGLYESGQRDEAVRRMKAIAPLDKPGFEPAHVWLANHLLEQPPSQQDKVQIVTHLRHALSLQPDRVGVAMCLAEQYRNAGRVDLALEILGRYEGTIKEPSTLVQFAELYQACGRQSRAIAIAQEISSTLRPSQLKELENERVLPVREYVAWAYAEQIRGNGRESLRILELAQQRYPNEKLIVEFLHMSQLIASFSKHDPTWPVNNADKIEMLLKNENLRDQVVMKLSLLLNSNPNTEPLRQLLFRHVEAADSPHVPIVVHEELAKATLRAGDMAGAQKCFENMIVVDPRNGIAHNDLAWLLAHHEPVDLPRALQLAERALEISPGNVRFHDTRGHILAKLNRWPDAVAELELAVNGLPNNRHTHSVLAAGYEKLGNLGLAAAHRKLSDRPN